MKENGPVELALWDDLRARAGRFRSSRVVQHVALLGSGAGIAQGIVAVNAILLARHLDPGAYGLFAGTFSAVTLSSFLFNWGLDTWLLRQATLSEDPAALTGNVLVLKSVMGALWAISLFLILPGLAPEIFIPPLVLVSILDVWCDGFFSAQLSTLNAQKRAPIVSSMLMLSRGGRLLGTIVLIVLGAHSPVAFAQARLAATFLALTSVTLVLHPQFPMRLDTSLRAFRESVPFALSDLLATIYLQADVTLLAIFLNDKRAVGLYSPASALVNALFAIPAAGYAVMVPTLVRLNGKERSYFRNAITGMFWGFGILGTLLWLGLGLSGMFLTELLLGASYHTTGELLAILSPILFFKSISFAGVSFLVAVGWQQHRVIAQAASAFANVFLNFLLIPRFGVWGVASVYVASEMILVAGYIGLTIRWFRSSRLSRVVTW